VEKTRSRKSINRNDSPIFVYFESNALMTKLKNLNWKKPSKPTLMTMREFVDRAMNESSPEYVYLGLALEEFEEIAKDAEPSQFFHLKVGNPKIAPKRNFWMGSRGVTAHTHYDSSHNFFAQLYGKKKFILSPPSAYPKLYLYPSLHPSTRQSQVDFLAPDAEKFPNFGNVPAYEVCN
jgi:poly-D-alanine transfer protein DltD